ncbi:MAG: WD40 repeat domain-containing protein [Myxococcota bacterium]
MNWGPLWTGVRGVAMAIALFGCDPPSQPATDAPAHSPSAGTTSVNSSMQVTGQTYAMAQQVRWLDGEHFVVGRWDGTISVFISPDDAADDPKLVAALAMPDGAAVRMIAVQNPDTFVSSSGEDSLVIWRKVSATEFSPEVVEYPAGHGFAVSGLFVSRDGEDHFITGHENGDLLIWSTTPDGRLSLVRTVDLRMKDPIDYMHDEEPLRHIRGLASWRDGIVIAGGEDGGLHQVRLSDGAVLSQRLFNRRARLGVNDLAVHEDELLVVNCAIDRNDRNVWLYALTEGDFALRDSANLLRDADAKRIFAFDIVTYEHHHEPSALVTTKEGLLWRIRFGDNQIEPVESLPLGRFNYGSAIDYDESTRRIAAAGISVRVVSIAGE